MRKIFEIFRHDLSKIFKSKMATIILIGVIFIPGIYAWLNIDSNWEPYDNTGNLKIAVVNNDQGVSVLGENVNIGTSLVENLEKNDSMNWLFTDSESAKTGVDNGEYYGAIVLPENFSGQITTLFDGGEIKKPQFDFYVNEKKNPIAPLIVSKAVGTIQTTLNQAFVDTIVYRIVDNAEKSGIIDEAGLAADGAKAKLDQVKDSIEQLRTTLSVVSTAADSTSSALTAVRSLTPAITALSSQTIDSIHRVQHSLNSFDTAYTQHSNEVTAALQNAEQLVTRINEIIDSINTLSDEATTTDPAIISEPLKELASKLETELAKVTDAYNNTSNTIGNTLASSASAAASAADILTATNNALAQSDFALANVINALNATSNFVRGTDNLLQNLETDIDKLSSIISSIEDNELYIKVVNLLKNSPDAVADFISEPIETNEIDVYHISSYGSKMAPFYTILAAWVGCTILVAILRTNIEKEEKRKDIRLYQAFLGKFLLFAVVAVLQGLAIGLGDLVMQVQTIDAPLFLFTIMLSSFVFMMVIYSLTVSFGKIGEAIAVVIMVLQVAGSGGTFPIELLPGFFQNLQPFMPFYPAMGALRETVGGFYQNDYLIYILWLLCHTIIPLLLGLVIRRPIIKLKNTISKRIEETGVIV